MVRHCAGKHPTPRWHAGFWRIASAAEVPILPVYFDDSSQTIGIGKPCATTPDIDADLVRLRAFHAPFRGRRHSV